MEIKNYIFEIVSQQGKVAVSGFGEFRLEDRKAMVDNDQHKIIPPGKEITFLKNTNLHDISLAEYIAEKENIPVFSAELEVKKLTNAFSIDMKNDGFFDFGKLGKFKGNETDFQFEGNRIFAENADFYGLEEINLDDLKTNKNVSQALEKEESGNYKFNNSILWIFLLLVPILGILYLGITQSEKIFGKKSFGEVAVKNSTHRIESDKKNDTLQNQKPSDSIKNLKTHHQ